MPVIRVVLASVRNCTYRGKFSINCEVFYHSFNRYGKSDIYLTYVWRYTENVSPFYVLKHILSEIIETVSPCYTTIL
jgi:hypothetical protein